MKFLSLKDEKEGLSNQSYSLEAYFAMLGVPFTKTYYTTADKERLKKQYLLENHDSYAGLKNPKGLEDFCFYLSSCVQGNFMFLKPSYSTFFPDQINDPTNRFNGQWFNACVESAVRTLVNCILYDNTTQTLNVDVLPKTISMNPVFKNFFREHNDPKNLLYYDTTLKDWLFLVSGVPGVVYKNDAPQGPYEISAAVGLKNALALVNYIFQTSADSFEELGLILSDDQKTIIFSKEPEGEKIVINSSSFFLKGTLLMEDGTSHADFDIKAEGVFELLENNYFLKLTTTLSDYWQQDLYALALK
jgi:hypothetical protein